MTHGLPTRFSDVPNLWPPLVVYLVACLLAGLSKFALLLSSLGFHFSRRVNPPQGGNPEDSEDHRAVVRGLLLFLNAAQHIFIDIHATRAPLSRGKLFDGPCDPAGSGIRGLGTIDPAGPIATTDGREVLP